MCGRSADLPGGSELFPGATPPRFASCNRRPAKLSLSNSNCGGHSPRMKEARLRKVEDLPHIRRRSREEKTPLEIGCRTISIARSAEILHQHNVAALLIYLRKEQPLAVGRNRHSPDITHNRFLWRSDRRDLACRKAEEFNQRAPLGLGRDEVNPLLHHCPGAK